MIKVLIVDDEKPICDLIDMNLTAAGYHCRAVQDGVSALKMIEGEKVEPFVYRFIRHDGSISRVLYYQCTVEAADHRPLIQSMYIWLDSLAL